ncbi:MAG: YpoC family protein [Bacillus sp. (in: firmicutes)]
MTKIIEAPIPSQLQNDYFFPQDQVLAIDMEEYQEWRPEALGNWHYEFLEYEGAEGYKPWLHSETVIPDIMLAWKEKQRVLTELYAKRAVKEAAPYMKEGICLAFAALYYSNERPVRLNEWQQAINELAASPVNFTERMGFIISRPSLYQSFKALEQIMIELEKMYARFTIRKQNLIQKKTSQQ